MTRSLTAVASVCLLVLAGCARDLSIPPPPPPTSARVRVTVTVVRSDAARVSVRAQQKLDERDLPATQVIPEDSKTLQPVSLGQVRTVEFNFPVDSTLINSGTWEFTIGVSSIAPGQEKPWETVCTTKLRKNGLNNLAAIDQVATCTGDFAVFAGQHEVGIGEVQVERVGTAGPLRVGDSANIKFIALNNGESTESFGVTVQPFDPAAHPVAGWTANVVNLPSGVERVVPTANDPAMTWDTSRLAPGDYIVQAGLTSPLPEDPQRTNDRNSTIVHLAAGDFDGDGAFDDVDNCPTVVNPDQANCDANQPGGSTLGDACNIPRIRDFVPNCNIAGGASVTVIGFGFANIQASDITIGNVQAAAVISKSACQLEFTNPQNNPNPSGMLRINTNPAVQLPLCCAMPTITTFTPAQGPAGTAVTLLGCGLAGVNVFLVKQSSTVQLPVPIAATSTAQRLDLVIPRNTPSGQYFFLITIPGAMTTVRSVSPFSVAP